MKGSVCIRKKLKQGCQHTMLYQITYLDYGLVGAFLLVIGYQVYFYCRYMSGIIRWQRRQKRRKATDVGVQEECPGVSVIVCARNEQENLQNYLYTLLAQDYPKFEVIVVNDGSEDGTWEVLEQYAASYPNLYVTFVPRDAHIISSKKLALTIGAKAAHYEYLLLTDADCRPESRSWIREMVSGFAPRKGEKTEIVLGYSAYFEDDTLLNSLINYDTLFSGMQYIGMAMSGHPYMGVGRNLAYRRDMFFEHNGFRGLLNERAGDDDLFVNKVATSHNTAVVCTRGSVTWSVAKSTWREWLHQKRRHLSVSPLYNRRSKCRIGIEPLSRGLLYGLLIATFALGSGMACCVVFALWLLRMLMQLLIVNRTAHRLGLRRYGLEVILYDILLPLVSLYMLSTRPLYKHRLYW